MHGRTSAPNSHPRLFDESFYRDVRIRMEAEFDRTRQLLEAACDTYQKNPSLENQQALAAFKRLPNNLPACRYIIERSNHQFALFSAIEGLQDAVLLSWDSLTPSQIVDARTFLLEYAAARLSSSNYQEVFLLVNKAAHAIAVISKRGWVDAVSLEETSTSTEFTRCLLEQLNMLFTSQSMEQRHLGVLICGALVEELESSSKATELQMPWEFHITCFKLFEENQLKVVFHHAFATLQHCIEFDPSQVQQLFRATLGLVEKVLGWRFGQSGFAILGAQLSQKGSKSVQPGPAWREILVSTTQVYETFFRLYDNVRRDGKLQRLVTETIGHLVSIEGDIFKAGDRDGYLALMYQGLIHILNSTPESSEDLLNISQIVERFVVNHRVFIQRSAPLEFFQSLTLFTTSCLGVMGTDIDSGDTNAIEAFDLLLASWILLAADDDSPDHAAQCGIEVFRAYINTRLQMARSELENEDEDDDEASPFKDYDYFGEQLTNIGQLGRRVPGKALVILHEAIGLVSNKLQDYISRGPGSGVLLIQALEEMHWLVLLGGYFVADNPRGESPSPPFALINPHLVVNGQDPLVSLVNQVLSLTQLQNDLITSNSLQIWSPLLGETLLWFLTRWSHSYLLLRPERETRMSMLQAWGMDSQNGMKILDFLVQSATNALISWDGETELQAQACGLLAALAKRKLPIQIMMNMQSWVELLQAHQQGHPKLQALPTLVQRKLLYALCAMELGDSLEEKQQYIQGILAPVQSAFSELQSIPDFSIVSNRPDTITAVTSLLERVRGVILATTSYNAKQLFAFGAPFFGAFVWLLQVYKSQHDLVLLVIKLFKETAKVQLDWLDAADSATFLQSCIEILRAFESSGLGKTNRAGSSGLARESERETCQQLLSCLNLLSVVSEKNSTKTAETIYHGLSVIIPLITPTVLQYPKLALRFFEVACNLFTKHTSKIPLFPDLLFEQVMQSFDFGLQYPDASIQRHCLESLTALATFNFKSEMTGPSKLSPEKKGMLSKFVKTLLGFLLFSEHFSMDLIEISSETFLAMMCSEKNSYMMMVQMLLNEQEENVRRKLASYFEMLMDGIDVSLEKSNRMRFREKLRSFLAAARALLKRK